MVLFYYDKFTAIRTDVPEYSYVAEWGADTYTQNFSVQGYTSYTFDKYTGKFGTSGSFTTIQANITPGSVYGIFGDQIIKWTSREGVSTLSESWCTANYKQTGTSASYSKGSLVQSDIVAEDGTYPANGRHSDGSWYVKKTAVGAIPKGTITLETGTKIRPNNGRKLIILDNGWWVSVTYITDNKTNVRVSKDEGENWESHVALSAAVKNVTIAAVGNEIAILYTTASTAMYSLWNPVTKTWTFQNKQINGNAMQVDAAPSMSYDKANNKLHIAMSVKYPGASYNIAHVYSSDKGNSFSATKMLTSYNATTSNAYYPDILALNNKVYLTYRTNSSGIMSILFMYSPTSDQNFGNGLTAFNNSDKPVDNPVIMVDGTGRVTIAFHCQTSSNAATHIKTRYSDDLGVTWKAPSTPINPNTETANASITIDKEGTLFVLGANTIVPLFFSRDRGNNWEGSAILPVGTAYSVHTLYDPERRFKFGTTADTPPPFIMETVSSGIQFKGKISTNSPPTIAIASPTDNLTLYENDVMNISGDTYDPDKDQSVTAYYQINSEPRKVLATNVSQTQISLTKQLKFKAGKLYDGDTAITSSLADGVAHKIKVWAVDSENASSTIVERTFYVVPNRAPLLSVDAVMPSGIVDADSFKISGKAWDEDANSSLKVTRRINDGNAVEIYNGPGGDWAFEVSLAQLIVGENTIVVEVIDNYGAKTSKTIKLNKNEVKTPILQSVARYKIEPPKGTAKGVLLFIERDKELDLKVELSMTLNGEQEQYETLTPEDTAQMPYDDSIVEDTFYYETTEAKDNIILKLTSARPDATVNHKIHLISGAVE